MYKTHFVLGAIAALFIVAASSQVRIIHPIYRPPPQPRYPIIRTAREVSDVVSPVPSSDRSSMPPYIDDLHLDPNRRASGSSSDSQSHAGPTHPRYNRRNDVGDEYLRRDNSIQHEDRPHPPSIYNDSLMATSGLNRQVRSLSTPGRGRVTGSSRSRGHDTGPTHPGYNRRNARSLPYLPLPTLPPFNPEPRFPLPYDRPRIPIYV